MKEKKRTKIGISDSAEQCVIDIEGTIGIPEECQFDDPDSRVTTYGRMREAVSRIADIKAPSVVVNIRSTGGDVNDALLIYEALAALPAKITTRCYGYTASAATVIAQAADEGCREIAASALYLVHNSVCSVEGNATVLAARAELLRKTDERIAAVYAARSGHDVQEFAALMAENGGEGRWLSPEEAVGAGLADAVVLPEHTTESGTAGVVGRVKEFLGIGGSGTDAGLPSDVNILHMPSPDAERKRSQIAFDEGQRTVRASRTEPCEDPSDADARPSANAEAYSADVRSFRRM